MTFSLPQIYVPVSSPPPPFFHFRALQVILFRLVWPVVCFTPTRPAFSCARQSLLLCSTSSHESGLRSFCPRAFGHRFAYKPVRLLAIVYSLNLDINIPPSCLLLRQSQSPCSLHPPSFSLGLIRPESETLRSLLPARQQLQCPRTAGQKAGMQEFDMKWSQVARELLIE